MRRPRTGEGQSSIKMELTQTSALLFLSENSMKRPGYVMVALQEIPDKLILVSRPLKERFVMNPAGGEIRSSSMPDVAVAFSPKTLNTPTKLILQVM